MTKFDIKITSDTVCPWCYFGYRRLQKAIALFQKVYPGGKNDTFTVHWAPYYLNPDPPTKSIPIEERLAQRVGTDEVQKIKNILTRTGAGEGIQFKFGGGIGNTRDSHKLIAMAGENSLEMQERVAVELFRGLFEEEQDIASHKFLLRVARTSGLNEDMVKAGLAGDDYGRTVDEEAKYARQSNIRGVPHFKINEQHELSGAQDPSEWMAVFTDIKEAEGAPGDL
ncbi:MAG: hypothetical protein M1822_008280 [Bathelium mastoideum]|nr:MAG: hypothetical protein M1822_008280 [Bathelium mastoideum]